jgi:hypothetical protein
LNTDVENSVDTFELYIAHDALEQFPALLPAILVENPAPTQLDQALGALRKFGLKSRMPLWPGLIKRKRRNT